MFISRCLEESSPALTFCSRSEVVIVEVKPTADARDTEYRPRCLSPATSRSVTLTMGKRKRLGVVIRLRKVGARHLQPGSQVP